MQKKHKLLVGGLLSIAAIFFSFTPTDRYFEIAKNMQIFAKLYQEVNSYYVEDVNPTTLMNTGIEAMLQTLDPYTNYIPEDKIEDYRTMTTGEYGGLGVVVGAHNGKVTVLMPNEGYPAHKAGLQIGDEILAVDGRTVDENNTQEISKFLKGQAKSKVTLNIKRFGVDEPFNVDLVRENIQLKNVPYYGMVNNDIGLIQLTDFTRTASKEVGEALKDLKSQGAEKIIIDLRGNPGGLLQEAVNISNMFLPKGSDIVTMKGKRTEWNKTHKGNNRPIDVDIPVAVLINGNSASAAEIVSGVIQDYDRGVLVGQRSFGKGLVQATRDLEYNSKLKVTVAKYYIPSGRCIQAIDYAHRDGEGHANKVPDSLRVAFETANGRTVYDGGGVAPDITVDMRMPAQITRALVLKGHIFDYATVFHFNTKTIPDAKEFKLTDEEYEDFVEWLKEKDYNYETQVENALISLEDAAKEDRYYDGIKEQIDALSKKISSDKASDLYKFKDEIKAILETEIAKRYYLQRGEIEASFDYDDDLTEAINVLNDTERYNKILSGN
ncbi:S41 family peptidase [Sediminitomix flava]|uniref:S41A family C-terminal processing peptidase-3 n=1 Tax=Sediminitomix flava TaxID=379075 RepID=A0A315YWU2_SEDFL|nr:S41 family peptidase [Sediminitomix flava]PWJ34113.1 S41A family C-terminal processing peptidase-3 [Sediminitomix flava]